MNPLAAMWLKHQIDRKDMTDLRNLAAEIRDMNRKCEPLRKEAEKAREERMRMEGDHGFIMVQR